MDLTSCEIQGDETTRPPPLPYTVWSENHSKNNYGFHDYADMNHV